MKNKIIIYLPILLFVVLFSCKSSQEEAMPPHPQVDTNKLPAPKPSTPTDLPLGGSTWITGSLFGQEVAIGEGDGWRKSESSHIMYTLEFIEGESKPGPRYFTISVSINSGLSLKGQNKTILVHLPTVMYEDFNNIEYIRSIFKPGLKAFHLSPTFFFTNKDLVHKDMVVMYGEVVNGERTVYTSAWGEQEGQSIEIVEVKEEKDPRPLRGLVTIFQVKFKINCKLYDQHGKFVGDAKNLQFVADFPYEPYNNNN